MALFGQVSTLYGHLTDCKNKNNKKNCHVNPETLTNLIDINYVYTVKWSVVAIFWPSGHFNGHFADCKYKKKHMYVMWNINLENVQALIDLFYMFRTQSGFC